MGHTFTVSGGCQNYSLQASMGKGQSEPLSV